MKGGQSLLRRSMCSASLVIAKCDYIRVFFRIFAANEYNKGIIIKRLTGSITAIWQRR